MGHHLKRRAGPGKRWAEALYASLRGHHPRHGRRADGDRTVASGCLRLRAPGGLALDAGLDPGSGRGPQRSEPHRSAQVRQRRLVPGQAIVE